MANGLLSLFRKPLAPLGRGVGVRGKPSETEPLNSGVRSAAVPPAPLPSGARGDFGNGLLLTFQGLGGPMRQVLFHVPLKAGFLPAEVPLPAFLLGGGLALALCFWLLSRYARRLGIAPEWVRSLAVWSALAGVASAVVVYALADQFPGGLPIYGFG